MIEIKEVQLSITLPIGGIGIVVLQPFIELSGDEPFRWLNNEKTKQIERIIRTLEIARQVDHGCEKTYFTIFPEYSFTVEDWRAFESADTTSYQGFGECGWRSGGQNRGMHGVRQSTDAEQ